MLGTQVQAAGLLEQYMPKELSCGLTFEEQERDRCHLVSLTVDGSHAILLFIEHACATNSMVAKIVVRNQFQSLNQYRQY